MAKFNPSLATLQSNVLQRQLTPIGAEVEGPDTFGTPTHLGLHVSAVAAETFTITCEPVAHLTLLDRECRTCGDHAQRPKELLAKLDLCHVMR